MKKLLLTLAVLFLAVQLIRAERIVPNTIQFITPVYSTGVISGTKNGAENYLYIDSEGKIYTVQTGTGIANVSGSTITVSQIINSLPAGTNIIGKIGNNWFSVAGSSVSVPDGVNINNLPATYPLPTSQVSDLKVVKTSTDSVIQDIRYVDKSPNGIIATLTGSATTYFYGYGTSFFTTIIGSTATFKCSWLSGSLELDGTTTKDGLGDNFEVPLSSPTYIYLDFPSGSGIKANVYIRGLQ